MRYFRPLTPILTIAAILLAYGAPLHATRAESIMITPPLYQLTLEPGQHWASAVKVVNKNPTPLTVWASAAAMEPDGEGGYGKFTPVLRGEGPDATYSLAQWLTLPDGPLTIASEQSAEVPFEVNVPRDASPGGHYAAILIGTKPAEGGEGNGSLIRFSQFVTSLILARVSGDVREEGSIREFSADEAMVGEARAGLTLRFENEGNVHLQPQGDIVITNLWGAERGRIPINQKTNFGNVLPQSTRRFSFTWEGENRIAEAGRHKAVVTLSYGNDARQSASAVAYFWVVPWKKVGALFGGLFLFLFVASWAVRTYVRKAIALESAARGLVPGGVAISKGTTPRAASLGPLPEAPSPSPRVLLAPIREGAADFIRMRQAFPGSRATSLTPGGFVRKYAKAFAALAILGAGIVGIAFLVRDGHIPSRQYEVYVREEGEVRKITPGAAGE